VIKEQKVEKTKQLDKSAQRGEEGIKRRQWKRIEKNKLTHSKITVGFFIGMPKYDNHRHRLELKVN
jgi:hypothetical protein